MNKPQLFLLHFAGGNYYSFHFLLPLLQDFHVFPIELPGRGKRIHEGLLTDFDKAAQDIYAQIMKNLTTSGFLIYGHSMGAYLALRVVNILEKKGRSPACLIVSGNAGPGIGKEKFTYLLGHQEFISKLESLGGVPSELMENKELFNFFEPILRADFEVAEKNGLKDEPAVNAPLYAIMGSDEEQVDQISNWGKFTRSGFSYEILSGDHFFIHRHPERISNIIKEFYTNAISSKYIII